MMIVRGVPTIGKHSAEFYIHLYSPYHKLCQKVAVRPLARMEAECREVTAHARLSLARKDHLV